MNLNSATPSLLPLATGYCICHLSSITYADMDCFKQYPHPHLLSTRFLRELLRCGDPSRYCRMRVKEPLHKARGLALTEVLLAKLVHRGNKGRDGRNGFPAVQVRFALVVAGVGVQQRHEQQRKQREDQGEKRQAGEVGHLLEHVPPLDGVTHDVIHGIKPKEGHGYLHNDGFENVLVHMMP